MKKFEVVNSMGKTIHVKADSVKVTDKGTFLLSGDTANPVTRAVFTNPISVILLDQ